MASADLWLAISAIGDFKIWVVISLAILASFLILSKLYKKHKTTWLVFILVPAIIISAGVSEVVKIAAHVPRPCAGNADCPSGFSFPSRHAVTLFAFATMVFLYVKKLGIRLGSLILAILVSISRVALNYHTSIDIIAGAIIGIVTAYLANVIYNRYILNLKAFKTIVS